MKEDIERLTEAVLTLTRAVHLLKKEQNSRLENIEDVMTTIGFIKSTGDLGTEYQKFKPLFNPWPEGTTVT